MIQDGRGKTFSIHFSNVVDLHQVTCHGEAKRFFKFFGKEFDSLS